MNKKKVERIEDGKIKASFTITFFFYIYRFCNIVLQLLHKIIVYEW